MEASLVALGGALLLAGVLGRLGRRVRAPDDPAVRARRASRSGPHTPGISLVDSPDDLGLLATFGLVMLLFHLGLEFSVRDLLAGGRRPRDRRRGVPRAERAGGHRARLRVRLG